MKQYILFIWTLFVLTGCTVSDYTSIAIAVTSKNPSYALESYAKHKSIQYATNPKRLESDLKFLSNFVENISKQWGKNNVKIPKKKSM